MRARRPLIPAASIAVQIFGMLRNKPQSAVLTDLVDNAINSEIVATVTILGTKGAKETSPLRLNARRGLDVSNPCSGTVDRTESKWITPEMVVCTGKYGIQSVLTDFK